MCLLWFSLTSHIVTAPMPSSELVGEGTLSFTAPPRLDIFCHGSVTFKLGCSNSLRPEGGEGTGRGRQSGPLYSPSTRDKRTPSRRQWTTNRSLRNCRCRNVLAVRADEGIVPSQALSSITQSAYLSFRVQRLVLVITNTFDPLTIPLKYP